MTIAALYKIFSDYPQICTDSRKIEPDCLFFALKGGNFDGNQFAAQAIEQGAAFAIIDDANLSKHKQFILVEDVLTTLQQLAHHHRKQFEIPVIGITGTNGKTTTKELISTVLESHYPTHYTKGNFNNHIGVPLTLLAMPADTEVAVIEMGANHVGEIDFLCQIAAPTHGLITNVGEAHLEGFGSFEGVKTAKGELYKYLEKNRGLAFINKNEEHLQEMAGPNLYKVLYTKSEKPDLKVPIFESFRQRAIRQYSASDGPRFVEYPKNSQSVRHVQGQSLPSSFLSCMYRLLFASRLNLFCLYPENDKDSYGV